MKSYVSNQVVIEVFLDDNGLYVFPHIHLVQSNAYGLVSFTSNHYNPSHRSALEGFTSYNVISLWHY